MLWIIPHYWEAMESLLTVLRGPGLQQVNKSKQSLTEPPFAAINFIRSRTLPRFLGWSSGIPDSWWCVSLAGSLAPGAAGEKSDPFSVPRSSNGLAIIRPKSDDVTDALRWLFEPGNLSLVLLFLLEIADEVADPFPVEDTNNKQVFRLLDKIPKHRTTYL